jgi:hypothetical protein
MSVKLKMTRKYAARIREASSVAYSGDCAHNVRWSGTVAFLTSQTLRQANQSNMTSPHATTERHPCISARFQIDTRLHERDLAGSPYLHRFERD